MPHYLDYDIEKFGQENKFLFSVMFEGMGVQVVQGISNKVVAVWKYKRPEIFHIPYCPPKFISPFFSQWEEESRRLHELVRRNETAVVPSWMDQQTFSAIRTLQREDDQRERKAKKVSVIKRIIKYFSNS